MTETVLFVGGSADGKRCIVRGETDRVDIPTINKDGFSDGVPTGRESYHRATVEYGAFEYHFYLISTESPDNLIPLLIEGYGRKEAL